MSSIHQLILSFPSVNINSEEVCNSSVCLGSPVTAMLRSIPGEYISCVSLNLRSFTVI